MDRPPLPLRARGAASPATLPAGAVRVGLAGVLGGRGGRGRRARATAAPGSLVARAWRWSPRDHASPHWWPQGVSVGAHEGRPVVLVSWFAQPWGPRRGRGSRVTVVDLGDARRPRYRHVELVAVGPDGAAAPVPIHAGGIAWTAEGDRLYAAATFGGIREFRLGDIARVGRRLVLPQHAEFAAEGEPRERMRYSFVSVAAPGELVAGEYRADDRGRIARLRIDDERAEIVEIFCPGIAAMQGVALDAGVWSISASRGERDPGDLWRGPRDALARHPGALPPGPEDLAHDAAGRLWGVSEFPRRRVLYELSDSTASAAAAAR
ncbi:hypothetical protein [Pseudolysinimonas sp.]|uniref:hypothetical protein n=1 Tax=Pseudolysinimonas sp. TaxID=2680009 RepID=UPI003F7D57EE